MYRYQSKASYCLHPQMKVVTVIALDYLVAFYPLLLIFILYAGIRLNYRGIRLCKPLYYCCARFRQKWDLKRSTADEIAAFLLLSYTKFIIVSILLLTPANLYDYKNIHVKAVLYIDGSVSYFDHEHIPYVIAALIILVVFVLCPPVLLLVYPKCPTCETESTRGRIQVQTELFLNTFYGCYKDGRDGMWDFRYFAGLYFVFRIVFFGLYNVISSWSLQYALQQIMCTAGIFLFAVFRPYRNDFYNKVDTTMFVILALVNTLSNYNYNLAEENRPSKIIFGFMYVLIWCPFVYMLLFLFNHYWKSYCIFWQQRNLDEGDTAIMQIIDGQEEQGGPMGEPEATKIPDQERITLLQQAVNFGAHSPYGSTHGYATNK